MDKIKKIENFLLKNYNVIYTDNMKEIQSPPYDQRYENIYLMGFFGYRPSNELIDAILNNQQVSLQIRDILNAQPEANEKINLCEKCFPKGDERFEKDLINHLKMYNTTGKFPSIGTEALTNPMKYSYIQRTKKTQELNILTPKHLKDIFKSILQKDDLSYEEKLTVNAFSDVCNVSNISTNRDEEIIYNNKLEEIKHDLLVEDIKEKRDIYYNSLKEAINVYSELLTNIPDEMITQENGIDMYFSLVHSASDDIEVQKQDFMNFMKNQYNPTVKTDENSLEIFNNLLKEKECNKGFIFPYNEKQNKSHLDAVNDNFDKELKLMRKELYDKKKNILNNISIRTICGRVIYKQRQEDIQNYIELITNAENNLAHFRNQYYNPAYSYSFPTVTGKDVCDWLDKYMDFVIADIEPDLPILDSSLYENEYEELDIFDEEEIYEELDISDEEEMNEKKIDLCNEIRDKLNEYNNVLSSAPKGMLTDINSIDTYFKRIEIEMQQIYKLRDNLINYIENEYNPIMSKCENGVEIFNCLLNEAKAKSPYKNFVFPYDKEQKTKYLDKLNDIFDEELKAEIEEIAMCEKVQMIIFSKSDHRKPLDGYHMQTHKNHCNYLLANGKKYFVDFRNKYYNPTHQLPIITEKDVSKWLNKYIELVKLGNYPDYSILDTEIYKLNQCDIEEEISNIKKEFSSDVTKLIQQKKDMIDIMSDNNIPMLEKINQISKKTKIIENEIDSFNEKIKELISEYPEVKQIFQQEFSYHDDVLTQSNVSQWLDEVIQGTIKDNTVNNFFNHLSGQSDDFSVADSVLDNEQLVVPSNNSSISDIEEVL
jgi:hypothetical protein